MGRVYILGAGASEFAGYPLGPDLWAWLRAADLGDSWAKDRAAEVIQEVSRILEAMPPADHDKPDLEALFTRLDLAEMGIEPLIPGLPDWSLLRPRLIAMITNAFLYCEFRLQQEFRKGQRAEAACTLQNWADVVRPRDTIITFNWDILHEAALWRAHKWHYADGYGFECHDAPNAGGSPVKVLKLHGSVNWAQAVPADCQPDIEHKADFFQNGRDGPKSFEKHLGQLNLGKNLITPSYLKNISDNRLLIDIWGQALSALREATEVVSIGYSLNPADALARVLISLGLSQNRDLMIIEVVSPTVNEAWQCCAEALGKEARMTKKSFKDWAAMAASEAHSREFR